ncbi:MAG: proline racemase family protein [Candidatus Limnocylindria bacterium]
MTGPVRTIDYHTGGEPFRIVTAGVPPLEGRTVLERRAWAAANLERVRHLLVDEPRGHADMYGGFVTPPDDEGADLGVVFFHNEGYSTACGHGTIALVTWAIESGALPGPEVVVDAPSGRLRCTARLDASGRVRDVRFENVPSYALALDVTVPSSRGPLTLDIGFGGAFYGSLDVRSLGLRVEARALPELIGLQRELRPALDAAVAAVHPIEPELRGIYGVIFWEPLGDGGDGGDGGDDGGGGSAGGGGGGGGGGGAEQRNVTVFADGEVDRSPCGSGTSARMAIRHARGEQAVGDAFTHRSIVDSVFEAGISGVTEVAGLAAVETWVRGSAFRTGEHTFELDPRDPLGTGFLLR